MSSTGGNGNAPSCEGVESAALAVMLGSGLLSTGYSSTAADWNGSRGQARPALDSHSQECFVKKRQPGQVSGVRDSLAFASRVVERQHRQVLSCSDAPSVGQVGPGSRGSVRHSMVSLCSQGNVLAAVLRCCERCLGALGQVSSLR